MEFDPEIVDLLIANSKEPLENIDQALAIMDDPTRH